MKEKLRNPAEDYETIKIINIFAAEKQKQTYEKKHFNNNDDCPNSRVF